MESLIKEAERLFAEAQREADQRYKSYVRLEKSCNEQD